MCFNIIYSWTILRNHNYSIIDNTKFIPSNKTCCITKSKKSRIFFYMMIWTCLPVMSNLTTSTTSNLWPFEFHISKFLSAFNMRFSNWSTWIGSHQFKLWNITGYIPRTLAGDRFNKDDICISEILQAIKGRTEICFMQVFCI